MNIGKDEIGPAGITALILIIPSIFLAFYGLLGFQIITFNGYELLWNFYGIAIFFLGLILFVGSIWLYFTDLKDHRKAKRDLSDEDKKQNSKLKMNDDNSIPSHDQIRHSILTILYKKAETNPNGNLVSREQVIELLNVPENMVDFDIKYLEQENLIKIESDMELWVWAEINSSGINIIEHKEENKNRFPFLNATIPIQIQTKIGLFNL